MQNKPDQSSAATVQVTPPVETAATLLLRARCLLAALRPKHWVKNGFLFLPLLFGKKIFIPAAAVKTMAAFILFSMATSVVYIVNDLLDLEQDKAHPLKRLRPIASGKVTPATATATAAILGALSISLSFILDYRFGAVVLAYIGLNILYSKLLKRLVLIDVFCLATFFLMRVMAGGMISEVHLSHWIVIMTFLLAMFLGFNKRRQELKLLRKNAGDHRRVLLQYSPYLIDQLIATTTASIVIAYMLYTVDPGTVHLLKTTNLIYSIPFVYYGIFRYLYLIHKLDRDGDPTRLLFSDRMMQMNIALWIIVCFAVIYPAR